MSVAEYVRALLASDKLGPQIRHHRCEPARAAVYAESRLPWPAVTIAVPASSFHRMI